MEMSLGLVALERVALSLRIYLDGGGSSMLGSVFSTVVTGTVIGGVDLRLCIAMAAR